MGWEREGEREDPWAESEWFGESIGLARNGRGAVCHSWRDLVVVLLWVYFPLYFPFSFLSMVFLLIIRVESNEKLYLKVLLVSKTVTAVSCIIREMWWADFLGCWDLQVQLEEVQLRRSAVFHAGFWDSPFFLSDLVVFQYSPGTVLSADV